MRFTSNATDGKTTLPTFFQWCKDKEGEKTALRYYVTKIWLPNKFPDITIETEVFRLRVSHKAPVFSAIRESIELLSREDRALAITEIDKTRYDYTLEVIEGEYADWEELGQFGLKLTIRDHPKSLKSSKRKPSA